MTVNADVVLTFPRIPAEKAAGMYLASKIIEKSPHTFTRESLPESSKLTYFNTKYKLQSMINTLSLMCKHRITNKNRLNKKWENLEELIKTLRDRIIKTDEFITNNQEKRNRCRQKIQHSSELVREREEQIEIIKEDIEWLKYIKQTMERKINEHCIYEDYLAVVVKQDTLRFKNIDSLILKFNDLRSARRQIILDQQQREQCLSTSQIEMKKLLQDKYLKHMQLRTDLSTLSDRYKTAKRNALTAENIIYTIYDKSISKKLEFVTVTKTCWNLYQHMLKNKYTKVIIREEDIWGQLREITKVMGLLTQVARKLGIHHR